MDDMNLVVVPVNDTWVLLTSCKKALTWARMSYNILSKEGKHLNTFPFALQSDSESVVISDEDRIEDRIAGQSSGLVELSMAFYQIRRWSLIDKSFLKGDRKV